MLNTAFLWDDTNTEMYTLSENTGIPQKLFDRANVSPFTDITQMITTEPLKVYK